MQDKQTFIKEASACVMPAYNRFPVVLDHGDGVYLYDTDGKKYIDFVAGIAVNDLGYNDAGVKETITRQMNKMTHVSNLYWTEPLREAAEALTAATDMDEVFFTNSGAEAIECAMKLARRWASLNKGEEASDIIAMNGSFHGRTYGSVTATGKAQYHEHFGPMLPGVRHVDTNDYGALEALVDPHTAAVMLEPIKGEGGIIMADPEYLKKVRALCDRTNTLLIFDEVQCGAARSGDFLACQGYGVKPDIVAMAKGIGAGFPVGACLAVKDVGDYLSAGTHGSTYGGNPLACAVVAHVVGRISQPAFLERVKERGTYFKKRLESIQRENPELVKDVRGSGLILGIELNVPVADVVEEGMKNGLLMVSAAGNTIRFVPPLIITEAEIDEGLDIFEQALKTVGAACKRG